MTENLPYKSRALATLSVSNMRAIPDHASELVSQVLMGTPLKLLDFKDKFYQVQTPENYLGWMDASGLQPFTEEEMESWRKSDRYFYNNLSGYIYNNPGNKGEVVSDLVLGDLFEAESEVEEFLKIRIPDGRSGYVGKAGCIAFEEWTGLEPSAQSVLPVARQMLGSPYLWGGASSKAVDCSGFVKLVFYSRGVILARDASQQARYGEPVDFRNMNVLLPGDLLFFGSSAERISHVGIYLGNGNFIHSSGRVQISSIVPGEPDYDVNRILQSARRIMGSLDTVGISTVKNHPWYKDKSQVK